MPANAASTVAEKVPITLNVTSLTGRPASYEGVPLITAAGLGTFSQDPATPNTFFVISEDIPGQTVYTVSIDADLGAGVELVQDTVTYDYTGERAANLGMSAGAPVPK